MGLVIVTLIYMLVIMGPFIFGMLLRVLFRNANKYLISIPVSIVWLLFMILSSMGNTPEHIGEIRELVRVVAIIAAHILMLVISYSLAMLGISTIDKKRRAKQIGVTQKAPMKTGIE